jgi:hypothetical protein
MGSVVLGVTSEGMDGMIRSKTLLAALIFLAASAPARAAVVISFYAHHLSSAGFWVEFPHAYVTLVGTTEVGTLPVKANFGFTPPVVTPAILLSRVEGAVVSAKDDYIAADQPKFSFPLTDKQYGAVLAVVERWRTAPQPSYEIDTHNCVIFVKEIAVAVGLAVSDDQRFVREPNDFLDDVRTRNAAFLTRVNGGHGQSARSAER